jgi:hypothetical protein
LELELFFRLEHFPLRAQASTDPPDDLTDMNEETSLLNDDLSTISSYEAALHL